MKFCFLDYSTVNYDLFELTHFTLLVPVSTNIPGHEPTTSRRWCLGDERLRVPRSFRQTTCSQSGGRALDSSLLVLSPRFVSPPGCWTQICKECPFFGLKFSKDLENFGTKTKSRFEPVPGARGGWNYSINKPQSTELELMLFCSLSIPTLNNTKNYNSASTCKSHCELIFTSGGEPPPCSSRLN